MHSWHQLKPLLFKKKKQFGHQIDPALSCAGGKQFLSCLNWICSWFFVWKGVKSDSSLVSPLHSHTRLPSLLSTALHNPASRFMITVPWVEDMSLMRCCPNLPNALKHLAKLEEISLVGLKTQICWSLCSLEGSLVINHSQICLTATYSSHSDRRTPKCFGLAAPPLVSFLTVESTRCCLKGKTVKMDCAM